MAWTNNTTTGTGLSTVPENGGFGFSMWTSSEVNPGNGTSYFTEVPWCNSAKTIAYPGLSSTDTQCFAISGSLTSQTKCSRKLISPLSIGGYVECRLGINYRNGFKGAAFKSNGTLTILFQAVQSSPSDKYEYTEDGSLYVTLTNGVTPWQYKQNSVFQFKATRTDENELTVKIKRMNPLFPGDDDFTHTVYQDVAIDEIEFFCGETNANDDIENTLFFNFLSGNSAYR